jgi:arsenate reductase-like glutaredoxin family protein
VSLRITITDIRAAGHCARGARTWFERHGFDFRAFLKDGISEEELLATGDALAVQVIEHKRERNRARGR